RPQLIRHRETAFYEPGVRAVDPSIFQVFTFPIVSGDPTTALAEPTSLVMTEETARKYFGEEGPIGKVVTMDNRHEMTVTAVMRDIPTNSSYRFDMLVPFDYLRMSGGYNDSWDSNSITTFVQLAGPMPLEPVNEKIMAVNLANREESPDYMLAPLTGIHLHSYFGYGRPAGDVTYVYIFSAIALFVLLIACINFMNLATARSARRAREIGLRKVIGARRSGVALQFLGETILMSFVALTVAVFVVALLIEPASELSGKEMSASILLRGNVVVGMLGIALFTGVVAGSYPAVFLSSFSPASILKSSSDSGAGSSTFRRVLVVLQFGLSIFLIIGTGIVYSQFRFMRDADLGYDNDHIVFMRIRVGVEDSYDALRQEWLDDPNVHAVTTGPLPMSIASSGSGAEWAGKDPDAEVLVNFSSVGYDYVESLEIEMAEGRPFSRDFPSDRATDSTGSWLVNEEMARVMGGGSIVGSELSFQNIRGPIVGVLKNFNFSSLRTGIEPLALMLDPGRTQFILLRVDGVLVSDAIGAVEDVWARIVPAYPFEYWFLDHEFDQLYRSEARMSKLLAWFAVIAIAIACLGLIGLAAFTAQQRRREIGIRKVLGASHRAISMLLCKEFLILVIVANVLAWPFAYLASRSWLDGFAYRVDVSIAIFLGTGLAAVVIALATVSWQAIRAALTDPVEVLRAE
ncbi:MAG TPA: FtsX-like permease family protein, partial [Rhodothermales bacterium]